MLDKSGKMCLDCSSLELEAKGAVFLSTAIRADVSL